MPKKRPKTADTFVRNLKFLIDLNEFSQTDLAKKSGVSQKSISNILLGEQNPTIETAEKIAKAFGLQGWHMIMPNLPSDLISSTELEQLLANFIEASESGREMLIKVAQREAQYNKREATA